jgi:exosortase A-associated hydrolase 1
VRCSRATDVVNYDETALRFDCRGASLVGVLAVPQRPAQIGVVVVVGGPQYRVGSHRQFVLLARRLAEGGIACLRFDYRGMGDSEGALLGFEHVAEDIRAAIDQLCARVPSVKNVVLWGLCDAAFSIMVFAPTDCRVSGVALFNPWVRSVAGEAEAKIKHYYFRRAMNKEFWRKFLAGKVNVRESVSSFSEYLRLWARSAAPAKPRVPTSLPFRFGSAMLQYRHPILIGLSGRDPVGAEFRMACAKAGPLSELARCPNVTTFEVPQADHTFSAARWRDEVVAATVRWLEGAFPADERRAMQRLPERERIGNA